ncbi:uncharacterized protein LOC117090559 [Trachypithecus francoisi]|uniref:uncharacterized protein LOC117090559 n=1 Tax=Trachypithecus francoisi TaxID=54180 RepID=UPI00141AF175|nr:uncharacterized protein LOC117090559 [Trachypithecus francoisi]
MAVCSSGHREGEEDVGLRSKFPGDDCNTSLLACGRQEHGVFPMPMWEGRQGQTPDPFWQEAFLSFPPRFLLAPSSSPKEMLSFPRSQAKTPKCQAHVSVLPLRPHTSLPKVPSPRPPLLSSPNAGIFHHGNPRQCPSARQKLRPKLSGPEPEGVWQDQDAQWQDIGWRNGIRRRHH